MNKLFLLNIFVFLFTGCYLLPCDWERGYTQLTTEPDHNKVSGIYLLNQQSVKYLINESYNVDSCMLELKSNGQYILTKAPDLIFSGFNEPDYSYVTKTRKWLLLTTENKVDIELEGFCVVRFTQKHGKFAIPITIGDGDECNGIIFEKAE